MSQSTAAVRPLPRRASSSSRPSLTVVPAPVSVPSGLGFIGLCLALVVAALLTMLLVNTARAENSFRAGALRGDAATLSAHEARLREELATRDDPAWLAERAQGLGMLPAGSPAHLDASTGALTGVATLPDPKTALTVLTGKFADSVPPLAREDKRPATQGFLSPAQTPSAPASVIAVPVTRSAPAPAAVPRKTAAAPTAVKPGTTAPVTTKPSPPKARTTKG